MELYINDIKVDLSERIPFPLTYQISDIKDISKRKGNSSKTISLPGTQINVNLMSNAFQLSNTDKITGGSPLVVDFDPSAKASARYYEGGVLVFRGVCQLTECTKKDGNWTFNIILFSDVIDFISEFAKKKVNELGWDEYDHPYTYARQQESWTGTIRKNGAAYLNSTAGQWLGEGYYYGLIDHGFPRTQPDAFQVDQITPSIFLKSIIDKMFDQAGITYTSSFFGSQRFKKLLLAYEGGALPKVDAQVAADASVETVQDNPATGTFCYDLTSSLTDFNYDGNYTNQTSAFSLVPYEAVAGSVVDVESQIQSTSPLSITVKNEGNYTITYGGDMDFVQTFTPAAGSGTYNNKFSILLGIRVFVNGVQVDDTFIDNYFSIANALTDSWSFNFTYTKDLYLNSNDQVEFVLVFTRQGSGISDFVDTAGHAGAVTMQTTAFANTCDLDLTYNQQALIPGSTVTLKSFMPALACDKFFKGLVDMFNLYVMQDPDEPTNLLIEPLGDFYQGSNAAIRWSEKLDHSEEITVIPTINLTTEFYSFEFQPDNDYWNTRYTGDVGLRYGDKMLKSPSQFAKGTTSLKLPFANKPIQNIPTTDLILPRNFTVKTGENGSSEVVPKKGKPYIVQIKNGTVGTMQTGAWVHIDENLSANAQTEYPYVGHLDDIDSPTFDLMFQVPNYIFYDLPAGVTYTTNNLYTYHEKFIKEIVSKNGKLLKCNIRLNASDINTLDFGRLVNIEGVVYRLQKIDGYDNTNDDTTKCEFVRIVEGEPIQTNTYTEAEVITDPYQLEEESKQRLTENGIDRKTELGNNRLVQ